VTERLLVPDRLHSTEHRSRSSKLSVVATVLYLFHWRLELQPSKGKKTGPYDTT